MDLRSLSRGSGDGVVRTIVDLRALGERLDVLEHANAEHLEEIDRRLQPMLERFEAWKKRCIEVLGTGEER